MTGRGLKTALRQALALVLLALLVGVSVNRLRSEGLALHGAPAVDESSVDLVEARGLFELRDVLFLDARPASRYAAGHIRGALNLPWPQAETGFIGVADRLAAARVIVAYCESESCISSRELARFLADTGFGDVRVFVGGWARWRQAGLPVESETPQNG